MTAPTQALRASTLARAALLALAPWLVCPPAMAQAPGTDPRGGAPLRAEPGDWWGDVHRWTGSDATRPARSTPPATRAETAPPEGLRRVTTTATGRANIRRDPSNRAPVLRTMPPGSALTVFAEAPEGWLQVGDGARPFGWIHQSALQAP
jgi:hypothetical protein